MTRSRAAASRRPGAFDTPDKIGQEHALPISEGDHFVQAPASPQFLLFNHGGSSNRGCEAIVRSTANLLKSEFCRAAVTVATHAVEQDLAANLPVDRFIHQRTVRRLSPLWLARTALAPFTKAGLAFELQDGAARDGRGVDAYLSIGGDNYCYGRPDWLYAINRALKRTDRPLVLWGVSIEPASIDAAMRTDLRTFDLVTARESLTYRALSDAGARVHLHPDPAFTMEPEELPLPVGWQEGGTLGLNVSPLVLRYERGSGITMRAVHRLVEHVLRSTTLTIALVPHVTSPSSNDLEPLAEIYAAHRASGRVLLLPGTLTAPQYKGYIRRCSMFIGARTHATIAAYSSCVPTLVIGYSVKARGIARDLFGDESLVVPVDALQDEHQLSSAFDQLSERSAELAGLLHATIPDVVRTSRAAVERVRAAMYRADTR